MFLHKSKIIPTLIVSLFFIFLNCSEKKPASIGETPWQIKMNNNFKDASKSPLEPNDLKNFQGLAFFPFDKQYIVQASLKKSKDTLWFNMITNTDRVSKERVYGVVHFTLKGKTHQLNVYQSEENLSSKDYKNYLFLPFLDLTNSHTTYGGGRYIDLTIPTGNKLIIDFNKAYNPLCVYNKKYSCPIVPRENFINDKVEAGVMKFKD